MVNKTEAYSKQAINNMKEKQTKEEKRELRIEARKDRRAFQQMIKRLKKKGIPVELITQNETTKISTLFCNG